MIIWVHCYSAHGNLIAIIDFRNNHLESTNPYVELAQYWHQDTLRFLPSFKPDIIQLIHRKLIEIAQFSFDQILHIHSETQNQTPYHIHNRDGTYAHQCGNGARCAIAYLSKDVAGHPIKLLSPTNVQIGQLLSVQPRTTLVEIARTENDQTSLRKSGIFIESTYGSYEVYIPTLSRIIPIFPVSAGNPHIVIDLKSLQNGDNIMDAITTIKAVGEYLNSGIKELPEGANVTVFNKNNSSIVQIVIYERGVGFTGSCGTALISVHSVLFGGNSGAQMYEPITATKKSIANERNQIEVSSKDDIYSIAGPIEYFGPHKIDDIIST